MKAADKIKKLIEKADVWIGHETDERILADAAEHLKKRKQYKSARRRLSAFRYITKIGVTRLAIAAAIVVVFGIGFFAGRRSKPSQPVVYSIGVTGYTSTPTGSRAEEGFWRRKVLAAMQPRPYLESQFGKTSMLDAYRQYLKEKHYD